MADTIEQSELRDVKTYEVGYLLSPLIPEDKVEESFEAILADAVKKSGASIIAQLPPRMINLAYPVVKSINNKKSRFNSAYFGAFRVEGYSDQILSLKEGVDKSGEVIRYLIISLSKDADKLMAPKVVVARKPAVKAEAAAVEEEKKEVDEAEIDKEIEGLLDNPNK